MSYHYLPHGPGNPRDVAHWRGARGGMRVLSLPSCQGWLRRQANDASYDFWSDLAIGGTIVRERRAGPASTPPAPAQAVYVMQKNTDGEWAVDPWRGGAPEQPAAANAALPAAEAEAGKAHAHLHGQRLRDEAITSYTIEVSRAKQA